MTRFSWALSAAALLVAVLPAAADTVQRPNFIIFIADDLACEDLGAYGNPNVGTPNIDRLAAEGMRFNRAMLTCSSCSPSRCSIMTGRYPHNTGAEQLHWPLPADQIIFAEKLKESGYWTASSGKWHLGAATKPKFDVVIERRGEWVETLRMRPKDRPFFLWAASTDPHRPYKPGAIALPHSPSDVVVPAYLPDDPDTRKDLALYYDAIARLDLAVGGVLEELDRQKIADETWILFMSDNGRPFPRAKTTVYDSGIKTPFIIRWPKRVAPRSTCDSLVSSVDIAPTILELAGAERPETLQGVSFQTLLLAPETKVRPYIFAEHNWHDYTAYQRAVRGPRYKLIRSAYTDLTLSPPADAVSSITFQAMRRLKGEGKLQADYRQSLLPTPAVELYDLESDPDELHNLAGQADFADVQRELSTALDEWQKATHDRIPPVKTPDEFSRETGKRLPGVKRAEPRPELRAEQPGTSS